MNLASSTIFNICTYIHTQIVFLELADFKALQTVNGHEFMQTTNIIRTRLISSVEISFPHLEFSFLVSADDTETIRTQCEIIPFFGMN